MKSCVIFLLIGMFSILSNAQSKSGEWYYTMSEPFYAATINDSGNFFGQWCDIDNRSCLYMVAIPTRCVDDESYPVLISSDKGAFSTTLVCRGTLNDTKLYKYALGNFDKIDTLTRDAKRIGFAIPLATDEFRVIRFSLRGSSAALSIMREAANREVPANNERSTRDERI